MLALRRRRRRSGRKEGRRRRSEGGRKSPEDRQTVLVENFPFPRRWVGLPRTQQPRSGSKSRSLPQEEGQPRPQGETGFGAAAFVCVIPRKRKAEKKCLTPPKEEKPKPQVLSSRISFSSRIETDFFLSGSEEGGSNSWRLFLPILFLGP